MSKWLVQARRATAVWGRLKSYCSVRMGSLVPAPPTHAHPFPRLHRVCCLKSAKHYQSGDGNVGLTHRERLVPLPLRSGSNPQHQISSRGQWSWRGFTHSRRSGAETRPRGILPPTSCVPPSASPTQRATTLLALTSTALVPGHPTGWLLPRSDKEKGQDMSPVPGRASALTGPCRRSASRGLPGARVVSGKHRPRWPAVCGTQRTLRRRATATSSPTLLWGLPWGTARPAGGFRYSVRGKAGCVFLRGKHSLPFPLLPVLKWQAHTQKNHPNHNGKP